MKRIALNVLEPVYDDFQKYGRKINKDTSALIRDAMEVYRQMHIERSTSLKSRQAVSVGGAIKPIDDQDDILADMLDDARN